MGPNTRIPDTSIVEATANEVVNRGRVPGNYFLPPTNSRGSTMSTSDWDDVIEHVKNVHEATLKNGGPIIF